MAERFVLEPSSPGPVRSRPNQAVVVAERFVLEPGDIEAPPIEPPPVPPAPASQGEIRATPPGGGPLAPPEPKLPAAGSPSIVDLGRRATRQRTPALTGDDLAQAVEAADQVLAPPAVAPSPVDIGERVAPQLRGEVPPALSPVEVNQALDILSPPVRSGLEVTPREPLPPSIMERQDRGPGIQHVEPITQRPSAQQEMERLDAFSVRLRDESEGLQREADDLDRIIAGLKPRAEAFDRLRAQYPQGLPPDLYAANKPGNDAYNAEVTALQARMQAFDRRRGAHAIAVEEYERQGAALIDQWRAERGSPAKQGLRAAGEAIEHGLERAAEAVRSLGKIPLYAGPGATAPKADVPRVAGQAALNIVNGLLEAGISPGIGVWTGIGATLEEADEALANRVLVSDEATARGIRLGVMPTEIPVDRSPEEHARLGAPITVREAIEMVGLLATLMGLGRVGSRRSARAGGRPEPAPGVGALPRPSEGPPPITPGPIVLPRAAAATSERLADRWDVQPAGRFTAGQLVEMARGESAIPRDLTFGEFQGLGRAFESSRYALERTLEATEEAPARSPAAPPSTYARLAEQLLEEAKLRGNLTTTLADRAYRLLKAHDEAGLPANPAVTKLRGAWAEADRLIRQGRPEGPAPAAAGAAAAAAPTAARPPVEPRGGGVATEVAAVERARPVPLTPPTAEQTAAAPAAAPPPPPAVPPIMAPALPDEVGAAKERLTKKAGKAPRTKGQAPKPETLTEAPAPPRTLATGAPPAAPPRFTTEQADAALEQAGGDYLAAAEALAGSDQLLSVLNAANQARRASPAFNEAMGGRPRTATMLQAERKAREQEQRGGFDPDNPEDLIKFVRDRGGIKPDPGGDLSEEWEAIPDEVKGRKRGRTPAAMAEILNEFLARGEEVLNDAELLRRLAKSTVEIQHRRRQREAEEAEQAEAKAAAEARAAFLSLAPEEQVRQLMDLTGASESDAKALLARQAEAAAPFAPEGEPDERGRLRQALAEALLARGEEAPWAVVDRVLREVGGAEAVARDLFGGDAVALSTFLREVERGAEEAGRLGERRPPVEGEPPREPWQMRREDYADSKRPHALPPDAAALKAIIDRSDRKPYNPDDITEEALARLRTQKLITGGRQPKVTTDGLNKHREWRALARENELAAGDAADQHYELVERALTTGKPVPQAVLDDYETLERPTPAAGPRFERTPDGDQGVIAGTEGRQQPKGASKAPVTQRPVEETPLFGQERERRQREQDEVQGKLFERRRKVEAEAAAAQNDAAKALSKAAGAIEKSAEGLEQAAGHLAEEKTPAVGQRPAPVRWRAWQALPTRLKRAPLEYWDLTEDIPGHPAGSTLTRQALEREGFTVPPPPEPAPAAEPEGPPTHKYSSLEIRVPPGLADAIRAFGRDIPREQRAPEGVEEVPHVTVRYGLHTVEPDLVRQALADAGPVDIVLGPLGMFPDRGDGEVLYVAVESPALEALHENLTERLTVTETTEGYHPHVTIAYLKPGEAEGYVGQRPFQGRRFAATEVVFSPKNGEEPSVLPLTGAESTGLQERRTRAIAEAAENPAFRRWFGESKVVDADGDPMVVYHGTGQPGFDTIDPEKLDPGALYGRGFYTTEAPGIAGGVVEDVEEHRTFDTREEAERAPRRSYWVWQETHGPDAGRFTTVVKVPRFKHRGYVGKGRMALLTVADRGAIASALRRSEEWRRHVLEPGYLTTGERESAHRYLNEWALSGHEGFVVLLADQPMNIRGLSRQIDAHVGAGAVYPVFLKIERPFDINATFTPEEAARIHEEAWINSKLTTWRDYRTMRAAVTGDDDYQITGEDIIGNLRAVGEARPATTRLPMLPSTWAIRQLQAAGYDGLTHIGGAITGAPPHRVWIAWEPTQVKSAIGNVGTYSPEEASLLREARPPVEGERPEPAPVWHSALAEAAEKKLPARATREQILGTLRSAQGVRADEIKWTYLEDWLREQPAGPIAKADVLAYLALPITGAMQAAIPAQSMALFARRQRVEGELPAHVQAAAERLQRQDPVQTEAFRRWFGEGLPLMAPRRRVEGETPTDLPGRAEFPGFFSALRKAAEKRLMPKQSRTQVLGVLRSAPGGKATGPPVKTLEVHWTGLEGWLEQQAEPVAKQTVLDYLKAHEVRIAVRELSEATAPEAPEEYDWGTRAWRGGPVYDDEREEGDDSEPEERYDHPSGYSISGNGTWLGWTVLDDTGEEIGTATTFGRADDIAESHYQSATAADREAAAAAAPRHGEHVEPGGEPGTYRERLYVWPSTSPGVGDLPVRPIHDVPEPERARAPEGTTFALWDEDRSVALSFHPTRVAANAARAIAQTIWYEPPGGHFPDAPNTFAHGRYDDGRLVTGEPVLRAQEWQSDSRHAFLDQWGEFIEQVERSPDLVIADLKARGLLEEECD